MPTFTQATWVTLESSMVELHVRHANLTHTSVVQARYPPERVPHARFREPLPGGRQPTADLLVLNGSKIPPGRSARGRPCEQVPQQARRPHLRPLEVGQPARWNRQFPLNRPGKHAAATPDPTASKVEHQQGSALVNTNPRHATRDNRGLCRCELLYLAPSLQQGGRTSLLGR